LNQKEATDIDIELMSEEQGFSNDQLMELAGLEFKILKKKLIFPKDLLLLIMYLNVFRSKNFHQF